MSAPLSLVSLAVLSTLVATSLISDEFAMSRLMLHSLPLLAASTFFTATTTLHRSVGGFDSAATRAIALALAVAPVRASISTNGCECTSSCSNGRCGVSGSCPGRSGGCDWFGLFCNYDMSCNAPSIWIGGVNGIFKPGDSIRVEWSSSAVSSPIKLYLKTTGLGCGLLWLSDCEHASVTVSFTGSSASGVATLVVPSTAGDGDHYYIYAREESTNTNVESGRINRDNGGLMIKRIVLSSVTPSRFHPGDSVTIVYASSGLSPPFEYSPRVCKFRAPLSLVAPH